MSSLTPRPLAFALMVLVLASAGEAYLLEGSRWHVHAQEANEHQAKAPFTGSGTRHVVTAHPTTSQLPISELHAWIVDIRTLDGRVVQPREILISGGMRMHGHGLPSRPRVERYLGEGRWLVSGVLFNMPGQWQLAFRLLDDNGADDIVLSFDVGHTSAADTVTKVDSPARPDRHEVEVATATGKHPWSATEVRLLKGMSLSALGLPRHDSGNRVADDPRAATLGKALFFDSGLSGSGEHSCASCHKPEHAFSDGGHNSLDAGTFARNTPGLLDSGHHSWFYWDGRRDSLWSQALVPIEAADELASSRVSAIRHIASTHSLKAEYQAVFGDLPLLAGLPEHASPVGDEVARNAWQALSIPRRMEIDTGFANIGKAIAAFERTLVSAPNRFDRYVETLQEGNHQTGKATLEAAEIRGLKQFINPENQCLNCHNGPLMSNRGFHNIGTGEDGAGKPDFGRMIGLQAALIDPFNCRGAFNDDQRHPCSSLESAGRTEIEALMQGAFKVPGLRNLQQTGPFMHDGRFISLAEVIEHYRQPPTGFHELRNLTELSDRDAADLVVFLGALGERGSVETPSAATADQAHH